MEQAAGRWAGLLWPSQRGERGLGRGRRGRQVETEKGVLGWCPDRPSVPSAILLLRGPFWALFREVPGVPGWHSAWRGVHVAITTLRGAPSQLPQLASSASGSTVHTGAHVRGAERLAWACGGAGQKSVRGMVA